METTIQKQHLCIPSVKLLGDYWSLRIIDALSTNDLRYCGLQRALDNINPVTLSSRLKKLEDAHIISRSKETLDKQSVVYSLTGLGRETLPVIAALNHFSAKSKQYATSPSSSVATP